MWGIHLGGKERHEFDKEFYSYSVLAIFYGQLKQFSSIFASSIRKLIEAKQIPGTKPRPFPLIRDFCEYFSENERIWLAKHDYTLCSLEILYYGNHYKPRELRGMFLNLLCATGDDELQLTDFRIQEEQEWDDEGENLLNGVLIPQSPFEMLKQVFYTQNSKAKVHAAYRVVYRWLDAFEKSKQSEEWSDAPDPNIISHYKLETFYRNIIQDLLHHERFGDPEIGNRLTNSVYRFFNEQKLNQPTEVLFFLAYFSDHDDVVETNYKIVMERKGGYFNAAANNLVVLYLRQNNLLEAQETVSIMDEGELKDKCLKRVAEAAERIQSLSALIALPEVELPLEEITDLQLIYLTSACLSAVSVRDNEINHRDRPLSAMLVPDFDTSHKILRILLNEEILRPKQNSWAQLDPEHATKYSITSLPLVPNIKGYYQLEAFVELLRDEIKSRSVEKDVIAQANKKIKIGWLLNSFYYTLEKSQYPLEWVALAIDDYERIELLVDRFSSTQLSSIGWNTVNFVAGTQRTHGFGTSTACERMIPRLLKSLESFSPTNFKSATYSRNNAPSFGLESALFLVDGVADSERYDQI